MRKDKSHRFLLVTNGVLLAVVAWGLVAGFPMFDQAASAQGRDNPASQRDAMVQELRSMNKHLAELAKAQTAADKLADKRFNDLTKFLKEGKVQVTIADSVRRGR